MKTINIHKFEELSTEAQNKAIEYKRYFNTEFDCWHKGVYEDAENIGVKITSFDIDRNEIDIDIDCIVDTSLLIFKNHGETCGTYKIAKNLVDLSHDEFTNQIAKEYLRMLNNEYDYLTSDESIKDSLISNDYDFFATGEMYTL